nr:TPA_asm: m13.5 sORF 2 [Murid betaherpesvirus 1]DBA07924.1 TPA_asm: m13.5 sORF 2 [Murid betaherpesvirus 1]
MTFVSTSRTTLPGYRCSI